VIFREKTRGAAGRVGRLA